MQNRNKEIARIFKDMSAIYQYLGKEERFRAQAYRKAAQKIENLQDDIALHLGNGEMGHVKGVGESMSAKIEEYLKKGRIAKFEELKKAVPYGLMELMDVKGLGPQTLKQLHEDLGIIDREGLINALENKKLEGIKGFGSRKIENIRRSLKLHKIVEERMLLWEALQLGNLVKEEMEAIPHTGHVALAGSLRRGKETIGDIDLLVEAPQKQRKKIVERFVGQTDVKRILSQGETRASVVMSDKQRQVDLRVINKEEWGSAWMYFTGSKGHNIKLRTIAKDKGWKISEYGLFDNRSGKRLAGETEEEVYRKLGFDYIPPELREEKGELEKAAVHGLPKLVELKDIRGDLQMHSNWSDGGHRLEDIVKYVKQHFPYEYIAITDHSKSLRVAHGLDEKAVREQVKLIGKINEKSGDAFLKTGIEVDILENGSLDLPPELLLELDWVTASIHTGLNRDNTERLLAAIENPAVCCIGHPGGRLIGKRDNYPVDWQKVFKSAAKNHTALEINAQPERLDLSDELAREAIDAGVMLVISTDSHDMNQFDFMQMGVTQARRAWCESRHVLNTRPWNKLTGYVYQKRKK